MGLPRGVVRGVTSLAFPSCSSSEDPLPGAHSWDEPQGPAELGGAAEACADRPWEGRGRPSAEAACGPFSHTCTQDTRRSLGKRSASRGWGPSTEKSPSEPSGPGRRSQGHGPQPPTRPLSYDLRRGPSNAPCRRRGKVTRERPSIPCGVRCPAAKTGRRPKPL